VFIPKFREAFKKTLNTAVRQQRDEDANDKTPRKKRLTANQVIDVLKCLLAAMRMTSKSDPPTKVSEGCKSAMYD
jgi:hypothetical protein